MGGHVSRFLILATAIGIATGCAPTRPAAPGGVLGAQAYSALSVALAFCNGNGSDSILLCEETIVPSEKVCPTAHKRDYLKKLMPELLDETIEDLAAHLKIVRIDVTMFPPTPQIRLLKTTENTEIFGHGPRVGWPRFHERFPTYSGIFCSTTVGFDSHGNQALVYIHYANGSHWTEGRFVLLAKQNGRWTVSDGLENRGS
jgi:hypothetical protein